MKAQDAKIMEITCRVGFCALYGLKESGQLIHAQASCLFVDLRQAVAKHLDLEVADIRPITEDLVLV